MEGKSLRVGVYLIQKPSTIALVEDTCEAPWLLLERLDVLDLDHKNVPRLCCLDLERAREIMDLSQIDVLHVIGAVVVFDLATSPVDALDLDDLAILDGSAEGDCVSESIRWM